MKRSTSAGFLILAVMNIIVALIPPCAGTWGAYKAFTPSDIRIGNNVQVGPELDKMIDQEAPMAKIESVLAAGINIFSCFLLLAGAAGLFMGHGWGRWVSLAGGILMIFGLLAHDVYQFFFYEPALMRVIDRLAAPVNAAPVAPDVRPPVDLAVNSLKWATKMYTLAWTCINPLIMLYFFVMAMCMAFMTGFYETDEDGAKGSSGRGGEDEDDDDDEEENDDDDDDRRGSRRKKDEGRYRADDDDGRGRRKKRDRDAD